MSCTIDIFKADFGTQEHAVKFVKLFNEMLEEDLCDVSVVSSEDVENGHGYYSINIEGSPLFVEVQRGDQLLPVIERFLKENQDAEFSAFYSCAFSNCGDTTYIDYSYSDGVLTVVTRWGELPYETYCEECDYDSYEDCDDDEEADESTRYLVDLETWEPDEEYKCPNCGAIIEFEATKYIDKIQITE